jgi:hypothetical protein
MTSSKRHRRTDREILANSLLGMADANIATDLLLKVASEAKDKGYVKLSLLQSLANVRFQAEGSFHLTPDAVRSCEESIRDATKSGELDPKLKNLDPDYVAYLCGQGERPYSSVKRESPKAGAGCVILLAGLSVAGLFLT